MQSKNNELANVASLLENLQQLSMNKDEDASPVDHVALLCETESLDHLLCVRDAAALGSADERPRFRIGKCPAPPILLSDQP